MGLLQLFKRLTDCHYRKLFTADSSHSRGVLLTRPFSSGGRHTLTDTYLHEPATLKHWMLLGDPRGMLCLSALYSPPLREKMIR